MGCLRLEHLDDHRPPLQVIHSRIVNKGLEKYLKYIYLDHQQTESALFAAQQVESIGQIMDSTTLYEASQSIVLQGGFAVDSLAEFTANIITPPSYQALWVYEYDVRDHFDERTIFAQVRNEGLGDLQVSKPQSGWVDRMTYSDLNNSGTIDSKAEILQRIDYYPYGMRRNNYERTTLKNNYQYNAIEHINDFGLDLSMATYRSLDGAMAQWGQVDPKAEAVRSLSPYQHAGNNPVSNADPDGDLFFAIPQISFSGGFSIGLEVGIGVPGYASISATGMVGSNSSWSVQGRAGLLYTGYGSNGAFAGVGYQWSGLSVGYEFTSGTVNAGLGTGFGNGNAGSVGLSYGNGGLGFNAGASSIYMWGTLDPGLSNQVGNTGDLQGGEPGRIKGNVGLYTNETEAYNVMMGQTQTTGVETSAWLTHEGVLLSPYETPEYKNTSNSSSNSFYKLDVRGKRIFAIDNIGREYLIRGQVHTHPSYDTGLSPADKSLVTKTGGRPVFSIGPSQVHKGFYKFGDYFMNYHGNTRMLLQGKIKLK